MTAAGRAGAAQRIQRRYAIGGQLSCHRCALMMIATAAAGAAGGTGFGVT